MNSPIEPGSPTLSTPSSGSDVEELNLTPSSSAFSAGLNALGATLNPRDSKSRKRDNPHHHSKAQSGTAGTEGERERERQGVRGGNYEVQKEKREKEELLDMGIVEFLRKELGDPFLEINFD
ncbi:hypothetical protein GGU10DRAFT_190996 [Lentinula aff. detonsa]|uniref:Uncharacterized protein n=1 Tax=Lentinula aff. detonsa TaxID=2804958 RepID=A0AA38KZJ4_9AGAR|nr:hypothetical protein GGU10DRAFT_190996 [Lentinula aff. detonsa]